MTVPTLQTPTARLHAAKRFPYACRLQRADRSTKILLGCPSLRAAASARLLLSRARAVGYTIEWNPLQELPARAGRCSSVQSVCFARTHYSECLNTTRDESTRSRQLNRRQPLLLFLVEFSPVTTHHKKARSTSAVRGSDHTVG
jgi:hypothetical protein